MGLRRRVGKASWINENLEPQVAFPSPDIPVAFFPYDAWVDAPRLAYTLVEFARRSGAETRFGTAVEEVEAGNERVAALRLQRGERLPVDAVVNAAGPEADRVAALVERRLQLKTSKGLLVRFALKGSPVGRLLHSPQANLRPDGPGRVLVHHSSIDQELDGDAETIDSLRRELLERARQVVPALEGAKVEEARVGVRPMPEDGLPCAGAVAELPDYY